MLRAGLKMRRCYLNLEWRGLCGHLRVREMIGRRWKETEEAVITVSQGHAYLFVWILYTTIFLDEILNPFVCTVIEETIQYRNEEIEATRWDYSLGVSETLPQRQVSDKLRHKISELAQYGPLVLVFHDASAETRYFQKLGIDSDIFSTTIPSELGSSTPTWPTKASSSTIIVQDTQNLYAGWSEPQIKQINLGKACLTFGLEDEARKLHNAGNDAFATLRIWEILLEMEEYERQKPGYARATKAEVVVPPRLAAPEKVKEDVKATAEEAGTAEVKPASDFPDLIELW